MAFQDLFRVAQQKSHRDRFERVRAEVQAKPEEPVVIVEYFKPGVEEFCSVLPPWLARLILNYAERKGSNFNRGLADYHLIVENVIKPALAGEMIG